VGTSSISATGDSSAIWFIDSLCSLT
jgi:hypothetical protein